MPDRSPGLWRPFSVATNRPDGARTAKLKAAVRETLELTDEHTIVLQQLDCAEPGCPPVETVVAVLSPTSPARKWKLHQPLDAITADDIRTTLKTPTHGEHS